MNGDRNVLTLLDELCDALLKEPGISRETRADLMDSRLSIKLLLKDIEDDLNASADPRDDGRNQG